MYKTISIPNRTSYFNPAVNPVGFDLLSPDTYSYYRQKVEGYELRLYYEFKYTQERCGQVFFYTLTYNDNSIPKYEGHNCFDYEHLAYLLNGGLKKQLERHYGTQLKYFVGAELGDGKGVRGLHNNPHYHVLFFLSPHPKYIGNYKKIHPLDFRAFIRKYWQGFDQAYTFKSFKTCKFGIAKEGDNYGLVTDYRACVYVSKYVLKDAQLRSLEKTIIEKYKDLPFDELKQKVNEFRNRYSNKCRISHGVGLYALEHIKDIYNPRVPFPSKDGFKMRSLPLYFYRKLFCDVVKNDFGNPIYIYNQLGKSYKLHHLRETLDKTYNETLTALSCIDSHINFPDINKDIFASYESFASSLLDFGNTKDIVFRYAIFKHIYKNRFYEKTPFDHERYSKVCSAPRISYVPDYLATLDSQMGVVPFGYGLASSFSKKPDEGWTPYSLHPYFAPYYDLFRLFDSAHDYFFEQSDRFSKQTAEKLKQIRSFHKKLNL